ncbi:MAG: hypothetical protein DWP98_01510 [Bacteroidetes bacterium]|nr:MAG: hypothetical protein DWP98_01510 [Bacteroidota bacterium]MBL1145454.1 hypothetical protein [Bacteroidota bacterium]NOG58252.1 trypsin-like serine protease [Bacteroidota bacterium]
MKNTFLLLIIIFFCQNVYSQYYYTYSSTPDSANIYMNGVFKCQAPCKVKFNWKEAIDDKILIELKVDGYEVLKDSLIERPKRIPKIIKATLTPAIPKIEFDSNSVMVVFDRFISDVENNKIIGHKKSLKKDNEDIIWKSASIPDEETFAKKFYDYLQEAGIQNPFTENKKLFSDPDKNFKRRPRYVIGVRLIDIETNIYEIHKKYVVFGQNAVGITKMKLEWQVFDRSTGKVALKKLTEPIYKYRQGMYYFIATIMPTFELGISQLFHDPEFINMVSKSDDVSGLLINKDDSTKKSIVLDEITNPAFEDLSKMIQYANSSCVTIISGDGGHGSGVIINDKGYVLTAYHVVDGAQKIEVKFSNGMKLQAKLIAYDFPNDIAIIDITGEGYQALPINTTDGNNIGINVLTIGTPYELELGQSVAKGILSGKRKRDNNIFLQTDVAVSPGNSGGPLLNEKGEIIGIIQEKIAHKDVEGIGFAIPMDRAIEVLNIEIKQK